MNNVDSPSEILVPPGGWLEASILASALRALADTAGLSGEVESEEVAVSPKGRIDAFIKLQDEHRGKFLYAVEVKTHIDRAAQLALIKSTSSGGQLDRPTLLATPYLSSAMAERCREIGLQFIDCAGNAYLRAPGLYVFVQGQAKPDPRQLAQLGQARLGGTATALRVVFSLLVNPELLRASYRAIAEQSEVSLGSIGGVLQDLRARGHLIGTKDQPRLSAVTELIDEWVTTFPIRLRPKLNPRRFHADSRLVGAGLVIPGAAWGGEVAADRLINHLAPTAWSLYVNPENRTEAMRQLVSIAKLRADPAGNLEIIDSFWKIDPSARTVPPLLIYADLLASRDPRNLEVAQVIRHRFLSNASA